MALNDVKVRAAKSETKAYKLKDSDGMVVVAVNGALVGGVKVAQDSMGKIT